MSNSQESLTMAVWSGVFKIGSVDLKCHLLSDGRRIVEADSIAKLFSVRGDEIVVDQVDAFMRWQRGK